MRQREGQLRALMLILMIVTSTILIGSALFIANTTFGVIGVLVTLLFGLFTVYNHYFEPPEGVSESLQGIEFDESETAGTRPELIEQGFDLNEDDIILSQLPPKRVAQVIYKSPNWQSDGHGGYSRWWRPRLRRLFHSEVFSNRVFEITLLGVTAGSYVLLYFIFLSFYPDNLSASFLEPLTEVYPSDQPLERTQVVIVVGIVIGFIGTAYFTIKADSTCPVCRSPFVLQSKKKNGSSNLKTAK